MTDIVGGVVSQRSESALALRRAALREWASRSSDARASPISDLDEKNDLSRSSTSDAERTQAYQKLQQIIVTNSIWVPLVHEKRVVVASPNLNVPRMHANVLYKMLDLGFKP